MKSERKAAIDLLHKSNIIIPPVDVVSIIKGLGIKYVEGELSDDVSGILDRRDKEKTYIFINEDHHINRKRFSAAHELGHYFLHANSGIHVDKQSFWKRDSRSSEGIYTIEIEANRFAAELLMPEEFLLDDINDYDDFLENDFIEDLARKYRVSTTAMSIKIQSLSEKLGIDFNILE